MKALGKFGLLLLAILLAVPISIAGVTYAFWRSLLRMSISKAWGYGGNLSLAMAIGIDMLGAVVARDLFNDLLIWPNGYQFGKPGETISRVLAINQRDGTLKQAGHDLIALIEFFDPGHMQRELDALPKQHCPCKSPLI